MSVLWTAADAELATGGQRVGQDWSASGVSIDSRSVAPGDLFIALSAARDGHDFVADALKRGAAAAMVSRVPEGLAADAPLLLVADVQAGLEALGRAGRARFEGRVVAITGSVGKTTTKEMLRLVLGRQGRVSAAEASYNNHWGVPLTLARLRPTDDYAIIEIGMNHAGEIKPLAEMARPHVAAITAIAPAHLEQLGSLRAIAVEKTQIYLGLVPKGVAVIPRDAPFVKRMVEAARTHGARIFPVGRAAGRGIIVNDTTLNDNTTLIRLTTREGPLTLKLGVPGRHFGDLAAIALGCTLMLGADLVTAALDLADWRPGSGRGMRERIRIDPTEDAGFELIDDAFNANPASVAAAIEVLAAAIPAPSGRRVLILGDMLELGPNEAQEHAAIATLPGMTSISRVHAAGPRMRALWDVLPQNMRGEWAESTDALLPRLRALAGPGDVVLVKGSKGSEISKIASALRALAHPDALEES